MDNIHQARQIVKHLLTGHYPSNLTDHSKEALKCVLHVNDELYSANAAMKELYKHKCRELEEAQRVGNKAREALNIIEAIKELMNR